MFILLEYIFRAAVGKEMGKVSTVYLDTNIIIGGDKQKEHSIIKELAIKGHIQLFIGPEVSREIRQQISDLKEEKKRLLVDDGKHSRQESLEKRRAINEKIKATEKRLSTELRFWKDAKPKRPNCTFEGIMTIILASGITFARALDRKGEIALLSSLRKDFNIKGTDAFHLMQAHSAKLDYFLSRDNDFVKKAKRIRWLCPKAMTPEIFLSERSDLVKPRS